MTRTSATELRGAVARADGTAVVAALASAGLEPSLQVSGSALLLAVAQRASGAEELALRCAVALRERDQDGDRELADELDAAHGAAPPTALADLPVELDQVGDIIDGGMDHPGGRIDLRTGEVWQQSIFDDDFGESEAEEEDCEDETRWLSVHPEGSRSAYLDMVDFMGMRSDRRLAELLEVAIDGRGAFRRFKNVLTDWPQDREEWFEFSLDRRCGRARVWLADRGYRALPSSMPGPDGTRKSR